MRNLTLIAAVAATLSSPALASSGLRLATPQEQLEQLCDLEAMNRLQADKVVAYTFSSPQYTDTSIEAPGAVFRKHESWYHLSYACTTDADHREVVSFDMSVGEKIPRRDWDTYYLYP